MKHLHFSSTKLKKRKEFLLSFYENEITKDGWYTIQPNKQEMLFQNMCICYNMSIKYIFDK